ncbi:putative epoxide hydrolase [Xylariaceae sp. FL0594]|nr:putative epoxide hydrolase [Xylariaceae sp. FL0594]
MAAGTITYEEHRVAYEGGEKEIYYLAAGPAQGPLIIFVHGWPGTGITWKPQIDAFAGLGFRVVAPDMPGYGNSTARKVVEDYSQEAIVGGLLALLADTGREAAIWVGHDWGSASVSSLATQRPDVVKALVNMSVPFHTIERGWAGFLPNVNRELYPKDEYEYGQWDYMKNWEENFENAVAWFEQDIAGILKATQQKTKAPESRFGTFATVRKLGWFGGAPRPPPVEATGPTLLPEDAFNKFVAGMQKSGFWGGSAYYLSHERNAKYNTKDKLRGGKLDIPVLFFHGTWDTICDTKTSRFPEPMRNVCTNLTEVTIEAGHFLACEKPQEVNAALLRFIAQEVPTEWPGFWDSGYTKNRT